MPSPSPVSSTGVLSQILADHYGLRVRDLVQLPIGQGTVNYRATCDDGREMFVKNYPPGTDVDAELRAIGLSELARRRGIPAAPVVENAHGAFIDASTPHAVSVWQWMHGGVETVLNGTQTVQAGDALGRIHALFAPLPESSAPAPQADAWRNVDPARLEVTIDQLLKIIAERTRTGVADTFDAEAERTLRERRAMLERIPKLIAELPDHLTTQVLHSDFSPVNLLFDGDMLTAVLDFRPPEPFLLSYDVGRMAFYPNTVATDPRWMQTAGTFIDTYRQANPAVADADVLACARVALLQLLTSLYGVKQHYLKPGLFQDDLDTFWLLRHQAVAELLAHLPDTDQFLADLVTAGPR
ncbi:phosphotransferase [Streptomyces sp. NPDC051572]|uniref:phosphotransferase enzyme family protein n=1 Tax=Streptomyces sp. NPDC051572 TaxID=3155802 RepID=UPI00344F47BF